MRTKKRYLKDGKEYPRYLLGRDFAHLEHVTNGIKGGAHGGDKRAKRRRERFQAKHSPQEE